MTVRAAELKSGLQPGDLVGAFDVEKCGGAVNDGKEVGANFCYRCMLGNKPVVMVFARKADKSAGRAGQGAGQARGQERRPEAVVVRQSDRQRTPTS